MATSAGRLFHGMDPFMIYLNSSLDIESLQKISDIVQRTMILTFLTLPYIKTLH